MAERQWNGCTTTRPIIVNKLRLFGSLYYLQEEKASAFIVDVPYNQRYHNSSLFLRFDRVELIYISSRLKFCSEDQ